MLKKMAVAISVVAVCLAGRPAFAGFQMTELAGLGGSSEAHAINDLGQAVGSSSVADPACRWAVLWTPDGKVVNLGTVNSKGLAGNAAGINNHGMIVGSRSMEKGADCNSGLSRAYVIVPREITDKTGTHLVWFTDDNGDGINDLMIDLFPRDSKMTSVATGINDAGQITGYVEGSYGEMLAFAVTPIDKDGDGQPDVWFAGNGYGENALMTYLDKEKYYSSAAYGINSEGNVVGMILEKGVPLYGVIWLSNGKLLYKTHLLSRAINDKGVLAGAFESVASLDDNGTQVVLGTLGGKMSYATALNNTGQVVGRSLDASGSPDAWRAFLWQDSRLIDLGAFGGGASEAHAVNKNGLIVGSSTAPGDIVRAALWTEIKTPVEQVETITNDLNMLVQDGSISQGDGAALTATLTTATTKLNQGNTTAACNALQAFVNQTNAKVKTGKLSAEQGKALVDAAGGVSSCK